MTDLAALLDKLLQTVQQTLAERPRSPDSTYRLQFRGQYLTFRDAAAIVPYLHDLGVSHVYSSPCFKAQSGSPHGYDVVDHSSLNPELGSPDDFAAMVETLHRHGMGQVLDIVPNHMGIAASANPLWNDVLENGPGSPAARYFDINWHPVKAELENKVLLPLLEDQYGKVLEAGRLKLEYGEGEFAVCYYGWRLPLDPRTAAIPLAHRLDELKEAAGADSPDVRELESILTALKNLPLATETAADRTAERQREKQVIKGRLRRLADESPAIAAFIYCNIAEFNGTPDDPHSFDRLDALLNAQVYRLSHWKAAADEINYRRFFDISELAAVCTEDPQVFESIHRLVFELLTRGDVNGLRIDHIDGLYDPLDYLRRVQHGYVTALARAAFARLCAEPAPSDSAPAAAEPPRWEEVEPLFFTKTVNEAPGIYTSPLYVIVEKILGPEEPLPADWPVAGTTGYDALNLINRLFVEPSGWSDLVRIYERFVDDSTDFRETAHRGKLLILREAMSSDLQLLAHQLNRISERNRRWRDFTLTTLRIALREILASFPVYRTYIRQGKVPDRDRQFIVRAAAQAKRRQPAMNPAVFDFIRDVLLLEQPPDLDEAGVRERELFVGRFQQVTSPLVAKGIEDTAFYQYFPLASLNEVGGDPSRPTITLDEFHRDNADRLKRSSGWLVATTTHDTKRSEDVRARINVLSEVPRLWRSAVNRWARLNKRHRREVDGQPAPSRNDEYLFYQTLIGAWPLETAPRQDTFQEFVVRIQQYMEKATHEAKLRTSWINPNADYDAAVRDFVAAALDDRPRNRFLAGFREFHDRLVNWGLYGALSQAFLKLTSAGVPDVYQGQEIWDFSLVDPDNRRPVDFARRRESLRELQTELAGGGPARHELARRLARNPRDPRLKLFVTWQMLQFRRQHPDLFRRGQYVPLAVTGQRSEHICAFAWIWTPQPAADSPPTSDTPQPAEQFAIAVAPRWLARLTGNLESNPAVTTWPLPAAAWGDTEIQLGALAGRRLTDLFTGQPRDGATSLPLAVILADFPMALLTV